MELNGYDIDGVLTSGVKPEGNFVIISGRTFAEYDDFAKRAAQLGPLYIRGRGNYGDQIDAGHFKASMINYLGVTTFHEDDDVQIAIIQQHCPNVKIVKH
jgi:hypothetical protein